MTYIYILVLAVVQGLTEFLPVSSSGHTEIFRHLMAAAGVADPAQQAGVSGNLLNLVLHFGTLGSVIVYYRNDLWILLETLWQKGTYTIIRSLGWWFRNEPVLTPEQAHQEAMPESGPQGVRLIYYLSLSTLVLVPIVKFKDDINQILRGSDTAPATLTALGIIYLANALILNSSYFVLKPGRNSKGVDIKSAILVGISQMLAVLPGLSRSGTTITTSLWLGIGRETAVKYSLLLSIPAILGGFVFELKDYLATGAVPPGDTVAALALGTMVSFAVGYLAISWLVHFVREMKLYQFGFYSLVVGIACLVAA